MKRLFLDDWRIPRDCATYMWQRRVDCRIYHEEWDIVRSYGQFIKWVETNGVPDLVAFDYDLADVEELKEELPIGEWFDLDKNRVYTGLDCAKFLLSFCNKNGFKFPEYVIHSANPDGSEEIKNLLV
jgi:hypothetical protein